MKTIICLLILSFDLFQSSENKKFEDCIPNKDVAIVKAESIWLPLYGESIYDKRPFVAELKGDSIWVVKGTLGDKLGGVPYLEIIKKDCRIIKISHGR